MKPSQFEISTLSLTNPWANKNFAGNSPLLFFLVIDKWRLNTVYLRLHNGRINCEIFDKLEKYLVIYVETVSVFFMELPISFNVMIIMKKKFHSKNIWLETKVFLSTVVYASGTASVFQSIPAKFVAIAWTNYHVTEA